jgi:hypothetical protein
MRAWIRTSKARAIVIAAISAITILTVTFVVIPAVAGGRADRLPIAESPTVASPTSSPSDEARPTPTPTPSATPTRDAEPAPAEPAPGQPAAPPPPPSPKPPIEPGVIGMEPGSYGCGEYPTGQTVYMSFAWTARKGNTVDIYYALTDTDIKASGGFTSLGSRLAASGSVQIPRVCPNGAGPIQYVTVKVVAKSPTGGSATAFYWGI